MPEIRDTDIEFDRYGDMSFVGNDISILMNDIDYIYQNVIDRLITNFNDYFLYKNLGANLSSFIGLRNSGELEDSVKESIRRSLTKDGFISGQHIAIASMREKDSILLKVQIGSGNGISETIIINSIFNTSSGLLHVTN
ncbi:MAG: hypothetical protein DRQ78_00125 [Epsilonproteobacteria bacterium]|nr:MAG: hypothetical protein DRQ78_00125 [Campylobacterota bacterium]